jgi:hypothetical protein
MPDIPITITHSSHPEFKYFLSTTVMGRQFARRPNTIEEIETYVSAITRQGEALGLSFCVVDDEGILSDSL